MTTCRPCIDATAKPKYDSRLGLGTTGLRRQESRQMASKLRHSVLEHIESKSNTCMAPPTAKQSEDRPGRAEFAKQYQILDMFEGDELDKKLALLSVEDLENIVAQENKDISCALTMARKNNIDLSSKQNEGKQICRRENGGILSRVCDTDEDISADVVARMLHAAEVKSALTAPPQVIYNLLFGDADYEPLPVISAAYDTYLSDVVVPLAAPANLETDPDLKDATRLDATADCQSQGTDDEASQTSETVEHLRVELMRKVLNLTGEEATLDELLLGRQQEMPKDLSATLSDFELLIEPEESKYQSLFQLRGSVPPAWFPDHYALFPDSPQGQLEKIDNPMAVLERAWQQVQPADMKPSEGIHMIGL